MDASATYRAASGPFDNTDQLNSSCDSLVKIKLSEQRSERRRKKISLVVLGVLSLLLGIVLLNYFLVAKEMWNFERRLSELIESTLERNSAKSTKPTLNFESDELIQNEKIKESAKEALEQINKLASNLSDTYERMQEMAENDDNRLKEVLQILRQNIHETNEKLANLIAVVGDRLQLVNYSTNCTLAKATNLTRLSNGKKYFFSYPNEANWSEADESCKAMGLHLATIRDETDLNATIAEATKRNR